MNYKSIKTVEVVQAPVGLTTGQGPLLSVVVSMRGGGCDSGGSKFFLLIITAQVLYEKMGETTVGGEHCFSVK